MNEDLQNQLAEMLAKLMAVAQDGATWAGQQIPPLIAEKIAFGRVWETICFMLFVGMTGLVGYFFSRAWRWDTDNDEIDRPLAMFFSGLGTIGLMLCCLVQLHNVLLVWFAPRLYIVEWLRGMVRS